MRGFVVLLAFQALGGVASQLGVPLPASVSGLLLLAAALGLGWVKLAWVEETAHFLIRHMVLLFIPVLAGLPGLWPEVSRHGVALTASVVVSWLAVLLTTGLLAQRLR